MSNYHRQNPDEPIRHDWLAGGRREATPLFYAKRFARDRWHVIAPSGLPVYDGADHGKDKPIVFTDEDAAHDYADRANKNES